MFSALFPRDAKVTQTHCLSASPQLWAFELHWSAWNQIWQRARAMAALGEERHQLIFLPKKSRREDATHVDGIWQLPHPNLHIFVWVTACAVSCQGWKSGMRAHGSMVETTQGRREALQRWKGDWIWVFKEHGRDLKLEQPGDYGLGKDLGRYCGNFLVRESFKCHRQDVLRSTTEICEVLLVLHKEQTTCDWRACSFKCWEKFFWKVCLSIL